VKKGGATEVEDLRTLCFVMHEPLRDQTRLRETVAVNRGMLIKVFETPEDAFEWLTNAR
jgi:hypothetical protein